jgi:hypothetical protein
MKPSLLLHLPVKQQLVEKHWRTKLGFGADTPNGANNQVSATTCSLMDFSSNTESESWALLPWLSIKEDF